MIERQDYRDTKPPIINYSSSERVLKPGRYQYGNSGSHSNTKYDTKNNFYQNQNQANAKDSNRRQMINNSELVRPGKKINADVLFRKTENQWKLNLKNIIPEPVNNQKLISFSTTMNGFPSKEKSGLHNHNSNSPTLRKINIHSKANNMNMSMNNINNINLEIRNGTNGSNIRDSHGTGYNGFNQGNPFNQTTFGSFPNSLSRKKLNNKNNINNLNASDSNLNVVGLKYIPGLEEQRSESTDLDRKKYIDKLSILLKESRVKELKDEEKFERGNDNKKPNTNYTICEDNEPSAKIIRKTIRNNSIGNIRDINNARRLQNYTTVKDGEKSDCDKTTVFNNNDRDKSVDSNLNSNLPSRNNSRDPSRKEKLKVIKTTLMMNNGSTQTKDNNNDSKSLDISLNIDPSHPLYQIASMAKRTLTSNRVIYACKTRAGNTGDGLRKTNQDSFMVKTNLLNQEEFHIFGVYDGHGTQGHLISNFVKMHLIEYFSKSEMYFSKDEIPPTKEEREKTIYQTLKADNYYLLKLAYFRAEQQLSFSKRFDADFSGTTACTIVIIGNRILCVNAGDSRALLVKSMVETTHTVNNLNNTRGTRFYNDRGNDMTEVCLLSRDHKPDLPDEQNRIIKAGGRVARIEQNNMFYGPSRVWLKNNNYPGLAMSRSLGDLVATSVGVTPEPEITETEINKYSKYIVIASDGVWEFVDNQKIMEIVNLYYKNGDISLAGEKIIEMSLKAWKKEDTSIDDITCVIVFLNKLI